MNDKLYNQSKGVFGWVDRELEGCRVWMIEMIIIILQVFWLEGMTDEGIDSNYVCNDYIVHFIIYD